MLKTGTWSEVVIQPCHLKLYDPTIQQINLWIGDLWRITVMQEATMNQGKAHFLHMGLNQCPAVVGSACHMMLALTFFQLRNRNEVVTTCHQTASGSLAKVENVCSGILDHFHPGELYLAWVCIKFSSESSNSWVTTCYVGSYLFPLCLPPFFS